MRKYLFIVLPFVAMLFGHAQAQQIEARLSDSAYAALLTCGPGNDFYTTFGHSAIRICDTTLGLDVVYNYGTFDFDTPHFYWRFALGDLNYCLSRSSFQSFHNEYAFEGRSVMQQRLRLTNQELNNLFVMLENNYLPENRYYRYDFFRDNCATRVRDILCASLSHRLLFVETPLAEDLSYRDILYQHTGSNLQWWQFGIDVVLGARCDHHCTNIECQFAPVYMMHAFDTARLSDTHTQLAEPIETLLVEDREPLPESFSPTLLFWLLFAAVLVLSLFAWRKGWRLVWLDILLFLAAGLVSLLVIFLWFCTSHYCTAVNLNILWASPLFWLFLFALRRSNRWFVLFQLAMLVLVCLLSIIGSPQAFAPAVMPIALTLAVRLFDKLLIVKAK